MPHIERKRGMTVSSKHALNYNFILRRNSRYHTSTLFSQCTSYTENTTDLPKYAWKQGRIGRNCSGAYRVRGLNVLITPDEADNAINDGEAWFNNWD